MTDIWRDTLESLELQMTRATFDTHLRGTYLVDFDDQIATVAVPSAASCEWLNARMIPTVSRTLIRVLGREVALQFVVPSPGFTPPAPPPPVEAPLTAAAGVLDPAAEIAGRTFDPAQTGGYSIISHYVSHFWMPYLGDAFTLWKRLDADKRIPHSKGDNYIYQPDIRWTPPLRFYYRPLARAIGKGHARSVQGGPVECWLSRQARLDKKCIDCCGRYPETRAIVGQDGRIGCYHWHTGALEKLYQENLVAVREEKFEQGRWANVLEVQVWRYLHLLTPAQVSRLPVELQEDHERWLTGAADRPNLGQALAIDLAGWKAIDAGSLIPLLPGWAEYRELTADFQPAAEFLSKPLHTIKPGNLAHHVPRSNENDFF